MTDTVEMYDELEDLKKRADLMGIKYHHAIGAKKLAELIKEALEKEADESTSTETSADKKTSKENEKALSARAEQMKLVRVVVYNNNINRKSVEADIFTVRNHVVGVVRETVPYGNEEGWHLPKVVVDYLKEKKYQIFITEKSKFGVETKKGKDVPEFTVKELPPLTEQELKDLAQRQAMSGSIDR